MAKTQPAQRTLKYLRSIGYEAQVVERWNSFAKIRQDLFGWIDVVAVASEIPGALGVQTTTKHNAAARLHKALGNKALVAWVKSGNRLVIHGWIKRGNRWEVDCRPVTLADLEMAS